MKLRSHIPSRRGFTLVEVIVVILITVALGAIIVPMVSNIRKAAGSAKTVANLRQIQAANASFASDNGGFFVGNAPFGEGSPWSHTWFSYMPFVGMLGVNAPVDEENGRGLPGSWEKNYPEVLKCGIDVAVAGTPRDDRNFTIAMNMTKWTHKQDGTPFGDELNGFWIEGKILQNRIKNPTQLITFYESADFWGSYYNRLDWKADNGVQSTGMAFRNKGGICHVVFADGHVGSLTRKDVEKENATIQRFFMWDAD